MHPNTKHGYKGTPTYNSWMCMKVRCNRTTASDYHRYGGRGIKVDPEWNSSFSAFLADMGERPKGMTLDRKDSNGDYCKSNCRWATAKQQLRNTRANKLVEHKGQVKCLADWADELNMDPDVIGRRLRKGWSPERAFTEPLKAGRKGVAHCQKMHTCNGKTMNIKEWAKSLGIGYSTLYQRLKSGIPFEEAIKPGDRRKR